jgi:hypothetical protein
MMEPQRATEIQEALIKGGYMTGTPSGHWDADSQAAMQKLQASKGWQTKLTPDSRALILLGLGPQQSKPLDVSQTSSTSVSALSVPTSGTATRSSFSLAALNK